jgi:integrase
VINFRDINQRFYEDFVTWMQEKPVRGRKENTLEGEDGSYGHTANFIGKTINNLKSIMNYALDQGVIEVLPYNPKKFVPPEDERIEHIHLNIDQLDEMWGLTFNQEESHLEIARDLFLVSAWTSLRFSDLERFNEKARISEDRTEITIVTQKTGEEVSIPLISPVPQILEKWDFKLPHMFNQKANKHIKTVACRLKGFDRVQTLTRTEGAERQTRNFPLCELVSTHTARRSFATNFVREFGVNPFTVMKLTGHKSFDVFQNYIKFGSEDIKNEINEKVQRRRNSQTH